MYRKILILLFIILVSGFLGDYATFDFSNRSTTVNMQNTSAYLDKNGISIRWESELDRDWRVKLAENFEYSNIFYPDEPNLKNLELQNELLHVSPIIGYYPYLDPDEFQHHGTTTTENANGSYTGSFINYSLVFPNEFFYGDDYYGIVSLKENGTFNVYYWKMDIQNISNSENIDVRESLLNKEFRNITGVQFRQRYFFRNRNTTLMRQYVLINTITKEIVAVYVIIWKPVDGTFYYTDEYMRIEYPRELHEKIRKE